VTNRSHARQCGNPRAYARVRQQHGDSIACRLVDRVDGVVNRRTHVDVYVPSVIERTNRRADSRGFEEKTMRMTLFRRIWPTTIALIACLVGSACGADQNGNASGSFGPTPAPVSNVLTIDVAEINGPYSFYPSPATVRSEQMVVWRNSDTVTHHVVFDDGSVDTGTLAPGTFSQPLTIRPGNWTYHCAIHPAMLGSVAISSSAITPTGGGE